MREWRLLLVALVATVAAAGCGSSDQTRVTITIRRGSPFREAADSLAAHGVVEHPRLFGFYAARRGLDRNIRYGTYLIRRGSGWNEVLNALQQGQGIISRVTIPEGWPIWDILPTLSKALEVPMESLEVAVRDTLQLQRVGAPLGTETLEGYLFPDTYDFPGRATARQAVDLMVHRFEQVWKADWNARLTELKMSRHQILTLASIVEKEVRRESERPLVAAVYSNRLRIRMPLQADPTVQYAQKKRPGRVLYRDLKVDSPYNTYRRVGLPPGPIASPGLASIEAALFPADVPYRFFVAHPDGHHEFRTTYGEHLAAIEMVRAAARSEEVARRDRQVREQAELDSALRAVGLPRSTIDSVTKKRP
ncbi:MAG: endolytic transglycosylase MltG [Gemmatimonadetes bacterium]|nr:endolytic transglycosylase MltG [Gemmatimonadota bacterium]